MQRRGIQILACDNKLYSLLADVTLGAWGGRSGRGGMGGMRGRVESGEWRMRNGEWGMGNGE